MKTEKDTQKDTRESRLRRTIAERPQPDEGSDQTMARTAATRRDTVPLRWGAQGDLWADDGSPITLLGIPAGTFCELEDGLWISAGLEPPATTRERELLWLERYGFSRTCYSDEICGLSTAAMLSVIASPRGCTIAVADTPYLITASPIPSQLGWGEAVADFGSTTMIVLPDVPESRLDVTTAFHALDAGAAVIGEVPAVWRTTAAVHV